MTTTLEQNRTQPVATRPPRGQVATNKRTLKEQLEGDKFKLAIAKVLPKHCTPERFVRVAIIAITRTPDLAKCDPETFFRCLMDLSAMGLEPDGRRAHLIPFWNSKRECFECQLIVDYKGLAELAFRSGCLKQPPIAQVVCENDDFEWDKGQVVRHTVDWRNPRGDVFAVYCIVNTKDGGELSDVMSRGEVERIRQRSKSGNKGPWVTDWEEMAKKTVFRRLSKWIPLSPEFRDALEVDDEALDDKRVESSKPIFAASRQIFDAESGGDGGGETEQHANGDEAPIIEKAPTESKQEPTPVPASPKHDPASDAARMVKAVQQLCRMRNVSEVDLIALLHKEGLDESLGTIRDLATAASATLTKVHDQWADYEKKLKEGK